MKQYSHTTHHSFFQNIHFLKNKDLYSISSLN
nr:MAG TPA: hypothetical protein [Crassvirales sp.]